MNSTVLWDVRPISSVELQGRFSEDLASAYRTTRPYIPEDITLQIYILCVCVLELLTLSRWLWSEFLATDPEVPGSIPGATRFSEK
jgi:hypothetical protein